MQYELISKKPCKFSSDDVFFLIYAGKAVSTVYRRYKNQKINSIWKEKLKVSYICHENNND
jgi:hypothetical protein